jgi:hypothetical protein
MKMKRFGPLALGTCLVCLLASATPVTAQESGDTAVKESGLGANVLLTLTIGEVKEGPRRDYKIVTRSGEAASLLVGWRTPIPTVRSGDADSGEPVTSYVYQNVGMTARLRPTLLPDGRLRLDGEIEISGSKKSDVVETPDEMPVIGTFQQNLDVIVKRGEPLRVAEVPDPEGGQLYLELEARLLD